ARVRLGVSDHPLLGLQNDAPLPVHHGGQRPGVRPRSRRRDPHRVSYKPWASFTLPRCNARTAILSRTARGIAMVNPQMVMYEEEFNQIQAVVDRLVRDANSKVVFIVDKNGQLIAASGDIDNVDTTSLASLTAGNIAATGGMAK